MVCQHLREVEERGSSPRTAWGGLRLILAVSRGVADMSQGSRASTSQRSRTWFVRTVTGPERSGLKLGERWTPPTTTPPRRREGPGREGQSSRT